MTKLHPLEKDTKREVKKLLDKHEWFWWMPPSSVYSKTGISDFNVLRNGQFLAIETKKVGKMPTANQKAYLQSVESAGGLSMVVDDDTLRDLEIWLEAFDRAVKAEMAGMRPTPTDGSLMLNALAFLTKPFHDHIVAPEDTQVQ